MKSKLNQIGVGSAALVCAVMLFAPFHAASQPQPPPGGGSGGPGGQRGPGGPGGPGRMGGPGGPRGFIPPRAGTVLSPFMQDRLKFTDAQKKKLAELQKDVDAKLAKILTSDQKAQLKAMATRPPGGRPGGGPGGGPGGRPGGPPPPK